MKKWFQETFSDETGRYSFKRFTGFLIVLAIFISVFKIDPALLAPVLTSLGITLGIVLGTSSIDKFSKK